MTNPITSDFQLDQLCKEFAQDIINDSKYGGGNWLETLADNASDYAHQCADGCFYVIYHFHALQICAHCTTHDGEDFVRDTGLHYNNINELATAIAYGEVYSRTLFQLEREIEFLQDLAQAEEV